MYRVTRNGCYTSTFGQVSDVRLARCYVSHREAQNAAELAGMRVEDVR